MPLEPAITAESLRFQFSALVQTSALTGEGPWAPAIPWALTYVDHMDQEVFYLANTDLLRQFPPLLDKLRALPENGAIAQEMLNQGLPCFLYFRREAGSVRINVAQYRDGRDTLLREDIELGWDELVGLLTIAARRFLTDLAGGHPRLRRHLNAPIASFNLWAARWELVPFQPPAEIEGDFETPSPKRDKKRRAPLGTPIYLLEWRNHKEANLRLNATLVATYVISAMVLLIAPLPRLPLGLWLVPLAVVAIPWLLVARYPVIPINSPLWSEHGIRYRVFFQDSVVLLSGMLLWLAASRHEAEVLWLWLFPLGWLLCLFCGLGFPGTHWARPLWDWSRPMILLSLLLASCTLWLLADIGAEISDTLRAERAAPRVLIVQTPAQDTVAQWQQPALKAIALPIARLIDEYTTRKTVAELVPHPHPAREPVRHLIHWLWLGGLMAYALGLAWAQLPSPTQVRIHSTPVN